MSANETSATIMASSLRVVVGDRARTLQPAGWVGSIACGVILLGHAVRRWAGVRPGPPGPDRQWRRGDGPVGWESQGRAPYSRDQRRGLEAILAVNSQTRAAGQGARLQRPSRP